MSRDKRTVRVDLRGIGREKLPNGWLRLVGVTVRKVGPLQYGERTEYVPADEAQDTATIASAEAIPATYLHPPVWLDASNTRQYATGSWTNPRWEGDRFLMDGLITDQRHVEAIEFGAATHVSCAYSMEPDGNVQRHVRFNHIASVPLGRCGDVCSIPKADRADCGCEECTQPKGGVNMDRITIDGVEHEVPGPVKALIDRTAGQLAAAEARVADAEKALTTRDGQTEERVRVRSALERLGERTLGLNVDLSKRDDAEIKRMIVRRFRPDARVDSASESYLDGMISGLAGEIHDRRHDSARAVIERDGAERLPTQEDSEEAYLRQNQKLIAWNAVQSAHPVGHPDHVTYDEALAVERTRRGNVDSQRWPTMDDREAARRAQIRKILTMQKKPHKGGAK